MSATQFINPRTDRTEYNKAYTRGWNTANRVKDADRALRAADARNESHAWMDGWMDAELGREKFYLREELIAEMVNEELTRTSTANSFGPGDVIEADTIADATVTDTLTFAQEVAGYGIDFPTEVTVTAADIVGGIVELYVEVVTTKTDYRTRIELPARQLIRTA